jgi:hypothetical protein
MRDGAGLTRDGLRFNIGIERYIGVISTRSTSY